MLSRAYFVSSKLRQPAARALAEISSKHALEARSRALLLVLSRSSQLSHFSIESSRVDFSYSLPSYCGPIFSTCRFRSLSLSLSLLILPFVFDFQILALCSTKFWLFACSSTVAVSLIHYLLIRRVRSKCKVASMKLSVETNVCRLDELSDVAICALSDNINFWLFILYYNYWDHVRSISFGESVSHWTVKIEALEIHLSWVTIDSALNMPVYIAGCKHTWGYCWQQRRIVDYFRILSELPHQPCAFRAPHISTSELASRRCPYEYASADLEAVTGTIRRTKHNLTLSYFQSKTRVSCNNWFLSDADR